MKRAQVLPLAALLLAGCGDSSTSSQQSGNSSGNPLTAPADYVGAVAKGKKVSEKIVDVTTLQRAIQAFQADEDRYPKDLNELVTSKILPTLPAPPYGMKFDYDPAAGKVRAVAAQ